MSLVWIFSTRCFQNDSHQFILRTRTIARSRVSLNLPSHILCLISWHGQRTLGWEPAFAEPCRAEFAGRKGGWLRKHLPFRSGPALRRRLRLVGVAVGGMRGEGARTSVDRDRALRPLTELAV